jgi:gamma-glutamyltranspeptidase / glutathione hydrolase
MRLCLAHLGLASLLIMVCPVHAETQAENGMVVSAHHLASDIGVQILKKGGNAIDAAVAVGYALAVTFPEAGNIGGGGFMTIRLADGRTRFIDFRETAPAAASATMYQDAQGNIIPGLSTRGYLSVAVPGTVAGLEYARVKYGTKARGTLLAPAIALARDGFVLDAGDTKMLGYGTEDFRKDAPSGAIFLNHGAPKQVGDTLVQRDLAHSLERVATLGEAGFYHGETARKIVGASHAHGGILTLKDLATYKVKERTPMECDYRGYHIISAPPPSSGGMVLCESLNILEAYPLADYGAGSVQSNHMLIEALRRAFHDRNTNLGDPDFITTDTAHFISKAYAADLRKGIDPSHATPSATLGAISSGHEGTNTTHYSIIDKWGNAVGVTYTLNDWFGAAVTPAGTGILLNDEMDDFSSKPGSPNMYGLVEGVSNGIAPHKRPLSSMSPTIITKGGKLFMVLGTPGGSRIPTSTLQVMLNVLDYHMPLQTAIDTPRIHQQWQPDVTYYEAGALAPDVMAGLAAKGQALAPQSRHNHIAAILVAPADTGASAGASASAQKPVLHGAIDPRIPVGSAAGY